MKKPILVVLLFFVFIFLGNFLKVNSASTISLGNQKVIYTLPYPGMLPDHPLFFIKTIRDNVQEFLTRDLLKKADFYLLLSDKYISMADQLTRKGKHQVAVSTAEKAEKYAQNITPIITSSKKQGSLATDDFIRKIQNSNIKHREMIEGMMKELPQGSLESITQVLEINKEVGQKVGLTE